MLRVSAFHRCFRVYVASATISMNNITMCRDTQP